MNAHPETMEQLDELLVRLAALEQRVTALEHGPSTVVAEMTPAAESREVSLPKTPAADESASATGVLSVLGAALLGIAGAYVLRAVSGFNPLLRGVVAVIAVAYAAAWLYAAARVAARRLPATLYSATSILILAPMLWEMTMRFQAMPASVAGLLLGIYTVAVVAVGFWRERAVAFSIAGAGAALTAVALCVGTHHTAPFAVILLALIAVCEFAPACRQAKSVRVAAALCADFVVWTLIYIYRLPADARTDYPPLQISVVVAIGAALFALEVAAVAQQAVQRAQVVSVSQALQTMVAFGLLVSALGWLIPGAWAPTVGALCLVLGIACSVVAYGRFRKELHPRNQRLFTAWSIVLLPVTLFLLAPASVDEELMGLAGVAAILLARRIGAFGLQLQGVTFLLLAAITSGMLTRAFHAFTGAAPVAPSWGILVATACAVGSYAALGDKAGQSWLQQALQLVLALVAAIGITTLTVYGVVSVTTPRLSPNLIPIAFLRTLVLCVVAPVVAWAGARLRRVQMVRVAYVALAFTAAKLLVEDLRQERMEFTAAAIFVVALTVIAVPRLARMRVAAGSE